MNKKTRIRKIREILERGEKIGEREIMWRDELKPMGIYKIPLEYLVYNKYNGRILSRVMSLEAQGKEMDLEEETGKKAIEKFLWDSKEDRNKKTKDDIEKYGQKEVGIITKDGVIIDGNRRVMLLNQIDKYDYFKAVVLSVKSDEDSAEIEKLETTYQMGEDEKLSYNPIEIYLKTSRLYKRLSGKTEYDKDDKDDKHKKAIDKIEEWMGDYKGLGVEKRLSIMKIMDEYLEYLDYNRHYTQLDGREDHFISLTNWLETFYGESSSKAFDGYKDIDVDDLKAIVFDYIRIRHEGKEFRVLGRGQKQSHLFGDREIWRSFKDKHFEKVQPVHNSEAEINLDSLNLKAYLDSRDEDFKGEVGDFLDENLSEHKDKINIQLQKDKPMKLISKALDSIKIIKDNENMENAEALDKVAELGSSTFDILQRRSPVRLLREVLKIISSINVSDGIEDEEQILENTRNIQSKLRQLEEEIRSDT